MVNGAATGSARARLRYGNGFLGGSGSDAKSLSEVPTTLHLRCKLCAPQFEAALSLCQAYASVPPQRVEIVRLVPGTQLHCHL